MIIVKNNIIPFEGFKAMSFWPFILVRKDCIFNKVDERHEMIHGRQQVEMSIVGIFIAAVLFLTDCGWWSLCPLGLFYECYFIEYVIRLVFDTQAYRNISFEQEAYNNEEDPQYLSNRKDFSWVKYLFKA